MGDDPFTGPVKQAFVGHCADPEVHTYGQSGGVVSGLLSYMLNEGIIDGAVVTRMNMTAPDGITGVPHIVHDANELKTCAGSIYLPVPLWRILPEIRQFNGKLAVVGLACHLHALENIRKHLPELAQNIGFTIGLFCDRVLTFSAMHYLCRKAGVDRDNAQTFRFRDTARTGYPGDVSVVDKENEVHILPAKNRMAIKDQFTPTRCRLCFDKLNLFSDIAVGDAWGIEQQSSQGLSSILVRTERGEQLIKQAAEGNVLCLQPIPPEKIAAGQKIDQKKQDWISFSMTWSESGGVLPSYPDSFYQKYRPVRSLSPHYKNLFFTAFQHAGQSEAEQVEKRLADEDYSSTMHAWYKHTVSPLVEIRGTGFQNKGAFLMFLAVYQRLKKYNPSIRLICPATQFAKLALGYNGVMPKVPNLYDPTAVRVLLDAAGFCWSDQWGPQSVKTVLHEIQQARKNNQKIILMPQAFGPFNNATVRDSFKQAAEMVDLIFARDKQSHTYINDILGASSKIHRAPDFTSLVEATHPENPECYANKVCLVPNLRMIDRAANPADAEMYLRFLRMLPPALQKAGFECFFLIHEGSSDLALARMVNQQLPHKIPVILEMDPCKQKGIINLSRCVISSRFHAVVSGLCQHIPTYCTGWSHKYAELMADYSHPEGILPLTDQWDQLEPLLSPVLEGGPALHDLRSTLRSRADEHKVATEKMWKMIFHHLKGYLQ
jgi:colanic acid/amylovoran biosynthesis protein